MASLIGLLALLAITSPLAMAATKGTITIVIEANAAASLCSSANTAIQATIAAALAIDTTLVNSKLVGGIPSCTTVTPSKVYFDLTFVDKANAERVRSTLKITAYESLFALNAMLPCGSTFSVSAAVDDKTKYDTYGCSTNIQLLCCVKSPSPPFPPFTSSPPFPPNGKTTTAPPPSSGKKATKPPPKKKKKNRTL